MYAEQAACGRFAAFLYIVTQQESRKYPVLFCCLILYIEVYKKSEIVYNTLHVMYRNRRNRNMVPRSSLIIRSLAGAYITYLGGKLLVDSLKNHPDNYVFYAGAGVVFVIIGIFWLGKYGSKLIKKEYQDDSVMGQLKDKEEQSEEAETEEAETEEAETEEAETKEGE
jgi:hypothetical protein